MLLRNDSGKTSVSVFLKENCPQTMQKFGLGYADKYSNDLYQYFAEKGYTDEVLKDSGLVTIDEARGAHDKF